MNDRGHVWHVAPECSGTLVYRPYVVGVPLLLVSAIELHADALRVQYSIAAQLRLFLSGGARPAWIDELERVDTDELLDVSGTAITAIGPFLDGDPPRCWGKQLDTASAALARQRLIDRLVAPHMPQPQTTREHDDGTRT